MDYPVESFDDFVIERAALRLVNIAREACDEEVIYSFPAAEARGACPLKLALAFLGDDLEVDLMISVGPARRREAALVGEAWGLTAAECQSYKSGWTHIWAGPVIDEFIKRFDNGAYPHLSAPLAA
jgi:hypothetical protein